MCAWSVHTLRRALGASPQGEDARIGIERVVIDSRLVQPGDLFVALPGNHHDGHNFVAAAADRGAAAALVQAIQPADLPQLQVVDSREALGRLGEWNRREFHGPVVAITGSAGKTTCKDMLAAILAQQGDVLATRGNRNNEIGLPLTLLELAPKHRYAVLEMGAARAGDIEYLCRFAHPDVGLVTNALPAHLQGFGDVDTVASTKGELYAALSREGTAIIAFDSPYRRQWEELAGEARILTFSPSHAAADVHARNVVPLGLDGVAFDLILQGHAEPVQLALLGRHQVANACAAAAAALALGIAPATIAAGLAALRPADGRLVPRPGARGCQLIDDSYNANPAAVNAAIDVLADCEGQRALLLGEMAELGRSSAEFHGAAGAYAAERGIEQLWAVGPSAQHTAAGFGPRARAFTDQAALIKALPELESDIILIKGSRSAAMEQVVAALADATRQGGPY